MTARKAKGLAGRKTMTAAFAVLCAAVALVILAMASPAGGDRPLSGLPASLDSEHLER